jgi:hypothetical protein
LFFFHRGKTYKGSLDSVPVAVKYARDVEVADVRKFLSDRIWRAQPKHENVLPVIGVSLDGGVGLVTPFCENGCLSKRLDAMNWFHRLRTAQGFVCGLKELHKAGVVHGAVKPGNIFLTKTVTGETDAAIGDCDFLGPPHAALTKLGANDCTKNYYAPEVRNGGVCTKESDVYGAGVVLLELLTSNEGRVPAPVSANKARDGTNASVSAGSSSETLLLAAIAAGWPTETASEVIELAAACVRPNPERRKTSLVVAKALGTIIETCVRNAGGAENLRRDVSAAEAKARSVAEKLEDFAVAKPRRRRAAEAAAVKVQAAWRARMARRRVAAMREGGFRSNDSPGTSDTAARDAEQRAFLAERYLNVSDAQRDAAVMIQKSYRGKLGRRRIMARLDADATSLAMKQLSVLGTLSDGFGGTDRVVTANEVALGVVFARIASMLADHDGSVQVVAAAALRVWVDPLESPHGRLAAEIAVRAGVLTPLVGVFCGKNARATQNAAACLETITIEFPNEQNRALRAGALEGALRLMVCGNARDAAALSSRAAGARALRGLLLQNPPACRRAMEKGGLDVLIGLMDIPNGECQTSASAALSALADADSDILQKLGVERLVSMAVRAETPPMRAATISFVSKLARDSDTHELIIEAGGLELLLGMILRANEEAVWGLASIASVEDNWDDIDEVFDEEGVESVRDLLIHAGDYGKEGAAWAVCYMSGHPDLQVKLVRGDLLSPLIEMIKNGTRRCKKAAERALKAMAM